MPILPPTAVRLKLLRAEASLDQIEMATLAKAKAKAYARWERGETQPRVDHIASLVRGLRDRGIRISADYLVGLSDFQSGLAPDMWIVDPDLHGRAKANPQLRIAWAFKVPRNPKIVDHEEIKRLERELEKTGDGGT